MKAVDSTNFTVNSITELQQNNEQNHTDNTNDIITLNNSKKMVPKNLNADDDSVNKMDDNQLEFGTVVNGNHKNDSSQHLNGAICTNGISSENKLMNLSLKNNTDIIKNVNYDNTNGEHGKVNKNCVNGISSLNNGTLEKNDVKASLESLNDTDIRLERGSDERKSMNSNHSSHSRTTQLDTDHENDLDDLLHRSSNGGDQQIHGYGNLQILQVDSGVESAASSWDRMAEVKEHAFARLQDELKKAHEELKLRDEEVTRLSRIRKEVESELEDLTASLFQEAHNMVREANMRQAAAEKSLKESNMQIDVLTAEVSALKTLVLTSTPSRPNPHLHPQIDLKSKEDTNGSGSGLFRKQHRRSPSHFNLKYGRESSPPDSPTKEQQSTTIPTNSGDSKESIEMGIWMGNSSTSSESTLLRQVDPVLHKEFLAWKQQPTMEKNDPFIARIYREDINWCLEFNNTLLGKEVQEAIENGSICIEAVSDKTKTHFPKKCALLESSRQCHYRMRFGDCETSYCISQICRNRITAVCDCLNYLRYIQRGLVKSSVHDIYWEIVRLRKEISLARLGLTLTSSS